MPRSLPAPNTKFRLSTFQERVLTLLMGALCMGTCLGLTDPRVGRALRAALRLQRRPLSSLSLVSRCQGSGGRCREAHSPRVSSIGPTQKDLFHTRYHRPPASPTSLLCPACPRGLTTSGTALPAQDPWPGVEEMRQPACQVETTQQVTLTLKTLSDRLSELGIPGLARSSGRTQEQIKSSCQPLPS